MKGTRLTSAQVYAKALGMTVAQAKQELARAWSEDGLSSAYIEAILRKHRWFLDAPTPRRRTAKGVGRTDERAGGL